MIEVKTPTENQYTLPGPIRKAGEPKLDDVPPEELKYPGWKDWSVPEDAECQDTLGMVGGCGRPAKVIDMAVFLPACGPAGAAQKVFAATVHVFRAAAIAPNGF